MSSQPKLTPEERRAIADLEALALRWPKSLWLYSASGHLHVMQAAPDGAPVARVDGGVSRDHIAATITGILNDGGDW